MSDKGKLNLIWFRDQESARRLRLRPGWIRAATYLLVLMLITAAGGVFASYQFWRRAQDGQTERRDLEKRLSETLIRLERLQNIEKLIQTSDAQELAQLLAGMGVDPSVKAQPQPAPQAKSGKDAKDAKDSKAQPPAQNAAPPQAPPAERPGGFDLAAVVGKVDLNQVGVENFRVRLDAKSIQYSFDLANLMPQSLAGSGQLFAVSREGTLTPVQTGKDDLAFSIQRFKQVSAQAPLPQGVEPSALYGFRLVLGNASGKTIFSETFPLAQAQ
ncbi:hypothetical protein [Fundidesulfovibrio magnetotacticus]|uniref:hypothetical protein n=1 Tax=Fundidesulfovibrio magnetotacticus TaxID=2730080 RepID=UPI0015667A7D|nr:hypothetical protein [Fundidesulfovibrio magnetotacticus]